MPDKALVIVSSGEAGKALTGLMWAQNALQYGWMEDVKVIFFGPAQSLVLTDKQVRKRAGNIAKTNPPMFCKYLSDQDGNSDQLKDIGMDVQYVGPIIADLIKDGYVPLVF